MAHVTVNQLIEALQAVVAEGYGNDNVILASSAEQHERFIAISPEPGMVIRIATAGIAPEASKEADETVLPDLDITLVLKPDRLRQHPEHMTLSELHTAISRTILNVPGSADRPVGIRAFPSALGDTLGYDLAIDVTDADAAPGSSMTYGLGLRLGRA